jgi:O-antigen/teichoic acid export membrane protein
MFDAPVRRRPTAARNAAFSAVQAVLTALLLFLVYRVLLQRLTPEDFGLWALLMSVAGLARLADFGVGTAAARFIALDLGQSPPGQAYGVLHTLVLFTALIGSAVALCIWLLSPLVVGAIVPAGHVADALQLLPFMLANLVCVMTGAAILGGVEGAQRFDVRAVVVLTSNLVFVVGCLLLAGPFGLLGVGVAQVLQGAVLLGGGWLAVRAVLGFREWLPQGASWLQLRRVVGFGASFQLIAVFQLAGELLIKSILTQRAGLPAVGMFEIAQRLATQLRAPLASACQVLVPAIAGSSQDRDSIARLYERSSRLLGFATLAAFGGLLISWPLLTALLLGRFSPELYFIALLVTLGWGLNLLTAPAYFALLGTGSTGWHVAGHGLTAAAVAAMACCVRGGSDPDRLVLGYVLALVAGSAFVVVGLHRRLPVGYRNGLPPGLALAVPLAAVLAAITVQVVPALPAAGQWLATVVALATLALALWPSWRKVRADAPGILRAGSRS